MPTPSERFWDKVDVRPGEHCWEWTACRHDFGYGKFGVSAGNIVGAHRYSWELEHGPIENGLHVLHRCDNPPCVNPAHLFLGTMAANIADMNAKGRQSGGSSPGETNPFARLTLDEVKKIRLLVARGVKQAAVAKEFSVSKPTVSGIVLWRSWSTA